MKLRIFSTSLLSAAFVVISTHCVAWADDTAQAPSAWQKTKLILKVGDGYGKENKGRMISGEYIYTKGPNRAGNVAMVCMNGSFMVVAATKDIQINKNLNQAWRYPKKVKRQPTVTINGEQLDSNSWIYLKKRGIAIPQSRKLSLKIYNAAIRGDTIRVDFDNKRDFVLNLPKPNSDFAYFGADCGMGRNK